MSVAESVSAVGVPRRIGDDWTLKMPVALEEKSSLFPSDEKDAPRIASSP